MTLLSVDYDIFEKIIDNDNKEGVKEEEKIITHKSEKNYLKSNPCLKL